MSQKFSLPQPTRSVSQGLTADSDWQIEAHYPGVEIRYIKGLKSKAEADEWLQGTRRIEWLRSQGYAK